MEIPATELPATEMDIITIENSVEETEKTEIFETEQIIETVLNKDEEVIDSINNK